MTRADLERLEHAALVELALRLQARVAALEAERAGPGGPDAAPPKTPENSSLPPAKGWKRSLRPPPSGVKRGPKPGHHGLSRLRGRPDHMLVCRPTVCGGCGADVQDGPQRRVGQHQITELPVLRAVVVEAQRYQATCRVCGTKTTAPAPPGFVRGRVFGPRLSAALAYLHQQHHIGTRRLVAVSGTLFGLRLSEGAVVNHLRRVAARLQPAAEQIKHHVRGSPVIGSDETSARVNGQTHGQWVCQTPQASYHVIRPSRGGDVLAEVLGDAGPEVWCSDLYTSQLTHPAQRHQVCLAHQLRDLQYARDCGDRAVPARRQPAFAAPMQTLVRQAIHLAHQRDAGTVTGAAYARQVAQLERRCDRLLRVKRVAPAGASLQARYRRHRQRLFVFLYDARVPPTNNGSEQALRPSVVHRKVSGGFRSTWGADAHATVQTVLQTARKQGQDLFQALLLPLGPPLPQFA